MIIFAFIFALIKFTFGYGFFGHDMISQLTWNQLQEETKHWICTNYDVCNLEDFKTLSALPDLLKHKEKFIKYFDLHFYNNLADDPPYYCEINVVDAFTQTKPNLLKAVMHLMNKFNNINDFKLSFTELSYFIHLIADIHQPFHLTNFEKGGMKRKLCDKNYRICWSLHALWDAEILKYISDDIHLSFSDVEENLFDVEKWALELNQIICEIYDYPETFGIEEYVDKFKLTALFLVGRAAKITAGILNNSNLSTPLNN